MLIWLESDSKFDGGDDVIKFDDVTTAKSEMSADDKSPNPGFAHDSVLPKFRNSRLRERAFPGRFLAFDDYFSSLTMFGWHYIHHIAPVSLNQITNVVGNSLPVLPVAFTFRKDFCADRLSADFFEHLFISNSHLFKAFSTLDPPPLKVNKN